MRLVCNRLCWNGKALRRFRQLSKPDPGKCSAERYARPGESPGLPGLESLGAGSGSGSWNCGGSGPVRLGVGAAFNVGGRLRLDSCRSCSFILISADASLSIRVASGSFAAISLSINLSIALNCTRTRANLNLLNSSVVTGSKSMGTARSLRAFLANAPRLAISAAFSRVISAIGANYCPVSHHRQ